MRNRGNRGRVGLALTMVVTAWLAAACATPVPSASPTVRPTPVITPDPHLDDPATADAVFLALGSAGLRLTANNAIGGTDDSPLIKRINATYLGWPLAVSQYRTSSALAKLTDWPADARPDQGQPPITIVGLNILIEWGPTTGSEPPTPSGPQLEGLRDMAATLDVLLSPLRARSVVTVPGVVAPSAGPSAGTSPAGEATPAP
ncbi:MAG: hypothetical protein ACSLFN_02475 [Candidatus Limnocylindrales bacterium]